MDQHVEKQAFSLFDPRLVAVDLALQKTVHALVHDRIFPVRVTAAQFVDQRVKTDQRRGTAQAVFLKAPKVEGDLLDQAPSPVQMIGQV